MTLRLHFLAALSGCFYTFEFSEMKLGLPGFSLFIFFFPRLKSLRLELENHLKVFPGIPAAMSLRLGGKGKPRAGKRCMLTCLSALLLRPGRKPLLSFTRPLGSTLQKSAGAGERSCQGVNQTSPRILMGGRCGAEQGSANRAEETA